MSNDLAPIPSKTRKPKLGDRLRQVAEQLRQEHGVQIKATAHILGAAAQIAENQDHLIEEVVEMVEADLDQQAQASHAGSYVVEELKQQFGKLNDAKAHFGVKATSWAALAAKLNQQAAKPRPLTAPNQGSVSQRLAAIEHEIQTMRGDMNQVLKLLTLILEKLT